MMFIHHEGIEWTGHGCDFSSHYLHFLGLNGNSKTSKTITISKHNKKYQHVRESSKSGEMETSIAIFL
jgi:hypothetical protein